MKENFWEMGETGPCGPCTEIHFDRIGGRDVAHLVNRDDPTVIEIWNLVFMQFNREPDGSLKSLPAKHVDTGMGLERLTSILQNVKSNYDTDIFLPIFGEIQKITGARPYTGNVGPDDTDNVDMAYRVVADHVRTLTFAITDGAVPGNEGRNYVLRRILRRAVRYGRQILGKKETGWFSKLVSVVVKQMSNFYPEVALKQKEVEEVILEEEVSFNKTLDRGLQLFEKACLKTKDTTKTISGDDIFLLYDTFGFPLDLVQLMSAEKDYKVDIEGFNAKMKQKVEDSHKHKDNEATLVLDVNGTAHLQKLNLAPTDDSFKYVSGDINATIKAIWNGTDFVNEASASESLVGFVLDKTNFYSESGGQTYDVGLVSKQDNHLKVENTHNYAGYVLHVGKIQTGTFKLGDTVELKIDDLRRKPIMSNHTFTHVLNFALRKVLGNGVDQKGSLVDPEKLRFDFSHNKPATIEDLKSIEDICNQKINENLKVYSMAVQLSVARQINGLRAVFGETYPDPVNVICIGVPVADLIAKPENPDWMNYSIEFCGGTHLKTTAEAKLFVLVSESGISKGVRRIVAWTGDAAAQLIKTSEAFRKRMSEGMGKKGEDLEKFISNVTAELENSPFPALRRPELEKQLRELVDLKLNMKKILEKNALTRAEELAKKANEENQKLIIEELDLEGDTKALHAAMQILREKCPAAAIMLFTKDSKKYGVTAYVGKDLQAKLSAGQWASEVAAVAGGKGGGKPESGQGTAQTTDPAKYTEAFHKARSVAQEKLQ